MQLMISVICLISPPYGLYAKLSDEPMYLYFSRSSSPYEPIHHQDPSEEVMTSAHRLEANTNYAYGGYLAGAEASHLLRNQSCTQLGFYNLLPSCLW
jgi:hypothetical protein